MRLTVPEPKIELYKDGFDEHDQLSRKSTGKKLSDLVQRINDPLVIALDGSWGSGKSFFLRCWVGEHLKAEYGHKAQTVYFDAFEHDFLDDPLIALTAAISARLEREPESTTAKAWRLAKNAAPFLGKTALRLGTAALVGKAVSLTGDDDGALNDIGDKMAEEGGNISKSLVEFWKKEDGKRAATEAFKTGLVEMTEPVTEEQAKENDELVKGSPTRKLVIVIDELDRCRPDYALSLLEIIKHFFNVDGVHFVLGVNLTELQNSVRARYGRGIGAAKYMQKFHNIHMPLTLKTYSSGKPSDISKYFKKLSNELGLDRTGHFSALETVILAASHGDAVGIRDIQRITTAAMVSPQLPKPSYLEEYLSSGLIFLNIVAPSSIEKLKHGQLTYEEADRAFSFSKVRPLSDHKDVDRLRKCWIWACGGNVDNKRLLDETLIDPSFNSSRVELLPMLIRNTVDTFHLSHPN